jgi:heat shock protein HtpX
MSNTGSLQWRALLAVALTIGFYLLALTVAGLLLSVVYVDVRVTNLIPNRLVGFCAIGAAVILWSIVPRREKFVEPGPRLELEQHPELFDMLRDVAARTRQDMPAEVYLIPDVNAYVTFRGRRRKVMGMGLTLMESLTIPQFKAVVAHEFGHYANDDLKFGTWIYRTREAMGRTLHRLDGYSEVLHGLFVGYANLFIRVTQAISRAQELAADRLAATITSAGDAAAALVMVRRAAYAYRGYLNGELAPVLVRGFRPPVAYGFSAFLGSQSTALDEAVADAMVNEVTDEADSHPPLRERLAALGEPIRDVATPAPRATSLLRDLPALETALIATMWRDPVAAMNFASIPWEEIGPRVLLPVWRENTRRSAELLRDVTPASLPEVVLRLYKQAPTNDVQQSRGFAVGIAGAALATHLDDLGWMCDSTPGKPVAFTRDGRTIEPFAVATKLQKGELTAAQWNEECRAAGLA